MSSDQGEQEVVQLPVARVEFGKEFLLVPLNIPDVRKEPVRRLDDGRETLDVRRQIGHIGGHHASGRGRRRCRGARLG